MKHVDHIVLDVETSSEKWTSLDKMGLAVAVVYEYNTDRYRVYGPDGIEELRERITQATRVTGHNTMMFDFPVIWEIAAAEWNDPNEHKTLKTVLMESSNDLIQRIWQTVGDSRKSGGWSLDAVCGRTIGHTKIGNGADAPIWYAQGLIQKVVNYCVDDVAMTRELGEFMDRYGYVIAPDNTALKILHEESCRVPVSNFGKGWRA